jgi:hypothetical protein
LVEGKRGERRTDQSKGGKASRGGVEPARRNHFNGIAMKMTLKEKFEAVSFFVLVVLTIYALGVLTIHWARKPLNKELDGINERMEILESKSITN